MTGSHDFGVTKELALVEERIRESIVSEEPLLHDIAAYVIEAGGKRIRPMVTLLAFQALGGTDVRQAIDLAAALEMIHSATLIHDDINDGGEMRRGRLAAYRKFGVQNALVTGDFLFVKAFGIGGKFDADIVELTAQACAALAEGEIRQQRHAYDTHVSREGGAPRGRRRRRGLRPEPRDRLPDRGRHPRRGRRRPPAGEAAGDGPPGRERDARRDPRPERRQPD